MGNAELAARFDISVSTIEKWAKKLGRGESLDNVRHPIAKRLTRVNGKWFVTDE